MIPQYWSWVLDHLVAADRMSRLSQEKGVEDLKKDGCINQYLFLGDYVFRINLLQLRA